jgi:uncharacterized protein YecA (UPF0149 family)
MHYSSAEDDDQGAAALRATAATMPAEELMGDYDADGEMPVTNGAPAEVALQPVRVEKTPGRNEPCYCGSGKKYKLCHGR